MNSRRLAVATAIFAIATALSRVAGLAREVVFASYFGTAGVASAFTLAFQLPNLVRALVADSALTSAFVPVFSELLEKERRREAVTLAASLFGVMLVGLTAITLAGIGLAEVVVPALTGDEFNAALDRTAVLLTQLLFPIVVLLGLNGLFVGILNAHDQFSIPAIAPLVWNVVIIAVLVGLAPLFEGPDKIYAYAIGVMVGTAVQTAMSIPPMLRVGFPLRIRFDWREPGVGRVARLMLPVSVSLGLINISLVINTALATRISESAARAIEYAFRIYMLPQGIFSVAVATVLFPQLSRLASRQSFGGMRALSGSGVRQIIFLLVPAAAVMLVLAVPITRLVFERGEFDERSTQLTAEALVWFALALPASGVNLLLTRIFFSLQRPWLPTALATGSLVVNLVAALALYQPFGISGIVAATVLSNTVMAGAQVAVVRRLLGGFDLRGLLRILVLTTIAAAAMAAAAYGAWTLVDDLAGRSLAGQIASVGTGIAAGAVVYAAVVFATGIPEARDAVRLVTARLRRGG